MRTKNALKNISGSFLNNIFLNILRFVSRTIFIKVLGEMYLGINGMLSNVLGILAFADLGIGSAISFSLYKPLAEKDNKKIEALMQFYKKAYYVVALVVLFAGLAILPFLNFFVKDGTGVPHLQLYYLLFLANMVIGYFFSYKRTLIIADQKEYKIVPIIMFSNLLLTIFQIIVILIFKNYFVYLVVQTLFVLFENVLVNRHVNKEYSYLNLKEADKLSKNELKPIKKNIKALIYHKVGNYFVNSTDNLIISKFLGLSIVGLYSNYYLIINMLNSFIYSALNSVISTIGNVNAKENVEKRYNVFQTINFLAFLIFAVCGLCLYNLLSLFVSKIWIGDKFLIDEVSVLTICLVFFINGIMQTNDAIKSSAGLYDKDKWVPIIQSIINIVVSIILVHYLGLCGVFIGTIVSALFVMIVKPHIIYKYIFERKAWSYYVTFLKQLLIIFIAGFITRWIMSFNLIHNAILAFIVYGLLSVFVLLVIVYIFYRNSFEYKDLKDRIKFFLSKKGKKA